MTQEAPSHEDICVQNTSKPRSWLAELRDKISYASFTERFLWFLWILVIIQLAFILKEGALNVGPVKILLHLLIEMAKLDGPRALPSDFGNSGVLP